SFRRPRGVGCRPAPGARRRGGPVPHRGRGPGARPPVLVGGVRRRPGRPVPAGGGRVKVLLVAEQLRRRVPGGIGTYVRGLVAGLRELGGAGADVTLWASRAPGGEDPLDALGPIRTFRLPSRVLVAAWDRGLVTAPAGHDVVHATSLAVPPPGPTPLTVLVHDVDWRHLPDAYPARGRRWHEGAL